MQPRHHLPGRRVGRAFSARWAAWTVNLLEEVDQVLELRLEVEPARIVEKVAWNLWAVLVEHAHEALLGHECAHHVLEDVRKPDPLGRGIDQNRTVVGHDVALDRDLEVLAVLYELPATDGAAGALSQTDAVVIVEVSRMRGLSAAREIGRRADDDKSLLSADSDRDHL